MSVFPGFEQLFNYDRDAKLKTLEFLESAEQPNQRAINIYAHIIAAERMWLRRLELQTKAPMPELWPPKIADDLRGEMEEVCGHWTRYLSGRSEESLSDEISYIAMNGDTVTDKISDILMSVLLHSAYHRGQVTTHAGGGERQAPFTDYIFFVR